MACAHEVQPDAISADDDECVGVEWGAAGAVGDANDGQGGCACGTAAQPGAAGCPGSGWPGCRPVSQLRGDDRVGDDDPAGTVPEPCWLVTYPASRRSAIAWRIKRRIAHQEQVNERRCLSESPMRLLTTRPADPEEHLDFKRA